MNAPGARAPPSSLMLWTLGLAGCAAAATAFVITTGIDERVPILDAVLVAWITLAYVFCGLIAWARRPESRFGPLMVAAGFGPMVSRLSEVDAEILQSVGLVCRLLPVLLFVHVFLAYPSGRLERRFERVLLATGYCVLVVSGFAALLLGLPSHASLIQVAHYPDAAEVVLAIGRIGVGAVALGGLGVLVARARSRGQAPQRSVVLGCFALALIAIPVGLVFRVFEWPSAEQIKWVAFSLIGIAPILFLIGFLRSRLARSAVGDLFVELHAEPAPADLRDALARALRDPSLDLVYWLPEYGSYANLDGEEVDLSELGADRAATLIEQDGSQVAALVHDPALQHEPELLAATTAAAAISLENGRLHADLRARLEELKGSRARILEAGQKERQRLERNLHDGAQQRLIALLLDLRLLEDEFEDMPEARVRLDRARNEIATSLAELRDVARGIHPAVVTGHGLAVGLEQLVARAPVPVVLRIDLKERLAEPLEVAAYYVVAESLTNIAKHAQAATARIDVVRSGEELVVEIVDDGIGGADSERGSGIRGLADRVEALDGRLRVWTPRGGGTRLKAEIPCA